MNKDQVKGEAKDIAGKVQEEAGKLVGSVRTTILRAGFEALYFSGASRVMRPMAGSVADGVLLPEYSSPAYIEAARRLMANPTAAVTTYAWFHVDDDREAARAAVRGSLTPTSSLDAQLAPLGLTAVDIASHVPDDVLDQLAVVGTPRDCAAALSALHDAGAGSVVVLPALDQTEIQVTRLAQEVLPLLR